MFRNEHGFRIPHFLNQRYTNLYLQLLRGFAQGNPSDRRHSHPKPGNQGSRKSFPGCKPLRSILDKYRNFARIAFGRNQVEALHRRRSNFAKAAFKSSPGVRS